MTGDLTGPWACVEMAALVVQQLEGAVSSVPWEFLASARTPLAGDDPGFPWEVGWLHTPPSRSKQTANREARFLACLQSTKHANDTPPAGPRELAETCRCDAQEAVGGSSRTWSGKPLAPVTARGRADLPAWLTVRGGPLPPREDGHCAGL